MKNVLFCLILLSGCASTTGPERMAAEDASAVPAGQEVICVRERQVGSHFSRRVCRTKAEMEEARREAAELLDRTWREQESTMPTE